MPERDSGSGAEPLQKNFLRLRVSENNIALNRAYGLFRENDFSLFIPNLGRSHGFPDGPGAWSCGEVAQHQAARRPTGAVLHVFDGLAGRAAAAYTGRLVEPRRH